MNQNIARCPLIIISIHMGWLVIRFKEEQIFLCPRIWWKNNQKRLMNHSSNEKHIDFDFFYTPSLFPHSSWTLEWKKSIFRIEFIIWDAFSARDHWFGIVDSRALPSTVGINRSYRRQRMPRFFIKACGQCCGVKHQLQSLMGADSMKIARQAGDKMKIPQEKKKDWWWWWSQFLRGNKPQGAPELYTCINLYTLPDRVSNNNSITHRWFLQPSCIIASVETDSLKQLRRETELLIPFKRGDWNPFLQLFLTQHIFQRHKEIRRLGEKKA